MSSPHGAFCESPHKAFVESPHQVRGCGETQTPFYVLVPSLSGSTWLYRIDGGTIVWQSDLSEQLNAGPANGMVRVEYNSHGLYCTLRDNAGPVIVRINESNGQITAQTRDVPPLPPSGVTENDSAPPICANRQHVFSIEWTEAPWIAYNIRKYDPDLVTIESKVELPAGFLSGPNLKRRINGRVNVITPNGLPRIGPAALDPDTLKAVQFYPVPNNGALSASMGDSVLIATGVDVFSARVSYRVSTFSTINGEYIASAANANLTYNPLLPGLQPVHAATREPALGVPAQFLELVPSSSVVMAMDPFTEVTDVHASVANRIRMTPNRVLHWQLSIGPLLPPGMTGLFTTVLRTYEGDIRLAGLSSGGLWAAQIDGPDTASPSLAWFVDLPHSGDAFRMQAASAVLGSGEDAPFTPSI